MGARYQTISASGYNTGAPSDAGAQAAENLISWSGIKTKLGDPLKTEIDAVNTALVSAFNYSVRQITASDPAVAGDHMRTIEIAPTVTTAVTITLADAATMTNIYRVYIKNSSALSQTIARATSGDTIDGVAASITIPAGASLLLTTNNAANGYLVSSAFQYQQLPPGMVDDFAGSTVPGGWLECDASAVSRTTYAALFAAIGTIWGTGNGSTTFNLPPSSGRGRIGRGAGTVAETVAFGSVSTGSDNFTVSSNNTKWITGQPVVLTTTGGLPTGLSLATTYYLVRSSATLIQFATTLANAQNGTVIDLTTQGTGNHTVTGTLTTRTLGEIGGEEGHAQSITELLAHTHPVGPNAIIQTGGNTDQGATGSTGRVSATTSTGGNAAMNVMNPFAVYITCIKT